MLKFIKTKLEENKELLKDNLILFIGVFVLNTIGYFFHCYAGRKLGPGDYGIFSSLLTLIYIILMPLSSLQITISKFVSDFKVNGEYKKINYLVSQSLKKLLFYSVIITILFLLFSPLIASFLKIKKLMPLIILSSFIILGTLVLAMRGVLQGLQEFKLLGSNYILEGIGKMSGMLLIFWGFGVNGAIGGLVISYIAALSIFGYIIKFLKREKEKFETQKIYKYSFPVFVMLISLTLFYSIDMILVKHFFDPNVAGYYAALALLGKIILFGSMSVSLVMFPKISESYLLNKKYKSILYKSLLLLLGFGGAITLFYFIFPVFTINLLFGKNYLYITNLLGLFGIVITIFSLIYLLAFYYISINKIKFIYLLIIFNLLEFIGICFFHESLVQIVYLLLILVIILFILLFIPIIFPKNVKKNFDSYSSL